MPRRYSLYSTPDGLRLRQTPVEALATLRGREVKIEKTFGAGTYSLEAIEKMKNQYELEVALDLPQNDVAGFNLCVGEGRKLAVSYDASTGYLTLDRTNCSDVKIPKFDRISNSQIGRPGDRKIVLRIFVDKSTVEIFADHGKKVLTALTYASLSQNGVEFFTQRGKAKLSLKAWKMKDIHS